MDAKRKELLKAIVKERFWEIGQSLKKAAEAKQAYKAALSELKKYDDVYTPGELQARKEKALQEYRAKLTATHAEVLPKLEELQNTLQEKHSYLDLNNPAWANALKLIEVSGGNLEADTIRQINAGFAGDVPAMKALQAVYKANGVLSDGGLEKNIYNVESTFEKLQNQARQTFVTQEGSLNYFAGNVGKVARLEGYDFETSPDPDGFAEAVARGAGLAES
jgi:beta-phosphoglucomutase-like phosphatase (HAD superfamily)